MRFGGPDRGPLGPLRFAILAIPLYVRGVSRVRPGPRRVAGGGAAKIRESLRFRQCVARGAQSITRLGAPVCQGKPRRCWSGVARKAFRTRHGGPSHRMDAWFAAPSAQRFTRFLAPSKRSVPFGTVNGETISQRLDIIALIVAARGARSRNPLISHKQGVWRCFPCGSTGLGPL